MSYTPDSIRDFIRIRIVTPDSIRILFERKRPIRRSLLETVSYHIISYHTISDEKLIARPLPSGPRHGDDESQAHSRFAAVRPTGRKY